MRGVSCGCMAKCACAHRPVRVAHGVDGHLDANGHRVVVRGEGGPLEARKDLALVRTTKVKVANLGNHLVMRHGHQVDDHGERTDVALLAIGVRIARGRVGAEGREEAEEGEHTGGVQEGQGDANDEDAPLGGEPRGECGVQFLLVDRLLGDLVRQLALTPVVLKLELSKWTGPGHELFIRGALVHGSPSDDASWVYF